MRLTNTQRAGNFWVFCEANAGAAIGTQGLAELAMLDNNADVIIMSICNVTDHDLVTRKDIRWTKRQRQRSCQGKR